MQGYTKLLFCLGFNFIEFLKTRSERSRATDLMRAQEACLAAVWDNPEDDVWNDA